MSKVKMICVMSVLVSMFFLSTGFVFAQGALWIDDATNNDVTTDATVGIGTDEPAANLHINSDTGNAIAWMTYDSTGYGGLLLQSSNAIFPSGLVAYGGDYETEAWRNKLMFHNGSGDIQFITGVSLIPKVTIKLDGRMGIGTDDPGTYKLAVEGDIGARKIVVTEAPWADFVFKKGYELPSLDKVESFIKENKHLPDIPSEKEIKEKGLSVADLMARQMQKIEELTLYLIELKKENEKLSDRLASLEQDK